MLMVVRYVEETMKENTIFDAQGLLDADESRNDRLKFWTNELCKKKPHTFDIAVAVSLLQSTNFHL